MEKEKRDRPKSSPFRPHILNELFNPSSAAYPYLKAILDAIPHGILITNEEGDICYANIYYVSNKWKGRQEAGEFMGLPIGALTNIPLAHDVIREGKAKYGVVKVKENGEPYYCDVVPLYIENQLVGTFGCGWEHAIESLKKQNAHLIRANQKMENQMRAAYCARYSIEDFWGSCENTKRIKQLALKMARSDADILIVGESGTGKEILSQAIHNASSRAGQRFVAINCATLSNELISSELFGYSEGAFTGAKRGGKDGIFETANHGTVLLDEIAELDANLQAKLLRVLEERCVRKIGSAEETAVDVRVIALTNKNLLHMVNQGTFRADLYYRLNVLSIKIPALHERIEDISVLARGILSNSAKKQGRELFLADGAIRMLEQYTWPGNVRELRNAVEYAANMCNENMIDIQDLPQWLGDAVDTVNEEDLGLEELLTRTERRAVESMLQKYGTSASAKKQIAEKLGISLSNLYNKMKRMGLS